MWLMGGMLCHGLCASDRRKFVLFGLDGLFVKACEIVTLITNIIVMGVTMF